MSDTVPWIRVLSRNSEFIHRCYVLFMDKPGFTQLLPFLHGPLQSQLEKRYLPLFIHGTDPVSALFTLGPGQFFQVPPSNSSVSMFNSHAGKTLNM